MPFDFCKDDVKFFDAATVRPMYDNCTADVSWIDFYTWLANFDATVPGNEEFAPEVQAFVFHNEV